MSVMGPVGEPKPFASLTSGLLARKGGAKPAMRRQALDFSADHANGHALEDLGWNDMGEDAAHAASPVEHRPFTALTPMPHHAPVPAPAPVAEPAATEAAAPLPAEPVAEATPAPAPAKVAAKVKKAAAPRAANGATGKGKSAFTLRIDPDRHLQLRLVCAVKHRSAQQILIEALDNYLGTLPEIAKLAGQVPTTGAK